MLFLCIFFCIVSATYIKYQKIRNNRTKRFRTYHKSLFGFLFPLITLAWVGCLPRRNRFIRNQVSQQLIWRHTVSLSYQSWWSMLPSMTISLCQTTVSGDDRFQQKSGAPCIFLRLRWENFPSFPIFPQFSTNIAGMGTFHHSSLIVISSYINGIQPTSIWNHFIHSFLPLSFTTSPYLSPVAFLPFPIIFGISHYTHSSFPHLSSPTVFPIFLHSPISYS